jgi:hypothetical protein
VVRCGPKDRTQAGALPPASGLYHCAVSTFTFHSLIHMLVGGRLQRALSTLVIAPILTCFQLQDYRKLSPRISASII